MSTDATTPEPDHEHDVDSDPALDDENPTDWSSEGGAVPEGPATHPDDGRPDDRPGDRPDDTDPGS